MLDFISQFKYISSFDGKGAYWQIPLHPESIWLTGFISHHGIWEWLRVPYGLKNSGSAWLATIAEVLKPLQRTTRNYVDDMGVGSMNFGEHVTNVAEFLTCIREAGITLNLKKCDLAKPEIRFLGYYAGSGRKRQDPSRVEAIQKLTRPTTLKELRSVLGSLGFHRPYIPRFAEIAKPLTDLTSVKQNTNLIWTDREQEAFDELKQHIPR